MSPPESSVLQVGDGRFEVRCARPGGLASFDALLDMLTEGVRRDQLTVLDEDVRRYGADHDWGLVALLDSIGPAAAVRLRELGASDAFGLAAPVLVGRPQAIRYIFSFAPEPEKIYFIKKSTPLWTDFTRFLHLWRSGASETDPRKAFRRLDAFGIGELMGRLHNTPHMWLDAHREQFVRRKDNGEMIPLDIYEHAWFLYRGPTAAQCATMLVPLLSSFDSSENDAFWVGYLEKRGDAGIDVRNYIWLGDHTGWKCALDRGDYEAVVKLVQAQRDQEPERELNANLAALLGMSYSRLGLHDQAIEVYEDALKPSHSDSPDVANLRFGLGQAHYRAGNRDRAAALFLEVVERERERATSARLLDAAQSMLARCYDVLIRQAQLSTLMSSRIQRKLAVGRQHPPMGDSLQTLQLSPVVRRADVLKVPQPPPRRVHHLDRCRTQRCL